jgi:hypothetical protein
MKKSAAPSPKAVREAVALPIRVESARRAFASDTELAELAGVHRSNVTRWKQGERPAPENVQLIVGLDVVVTLLSQFLDPRSVPKWLRGFNAHLGGRRPLDVLRAGRLSEVIAAIEAERQGAFA